MISEKRSCPFCCEYIDEIIIQTSLLMAVAFFSADKLRVPVTREDQQADPVPTSSTISSTCSFNVPAFNRSPFRKTVDEIYRTGLQLGALGHVPTREMLFLPIPLLSVHDKRLFHLFDHFFQTNPGFEMIAKPSQCHSA
jgi:hypothetical protein